MCSASAQVQSHWLCCTRLWKGHSPGGDWAQHMFQLPAQVIQKEAKLSRPQLHNFTSLQLQEQSVPGPRCNCNALKLRLTPPFLDMTPGLVNLSQGPV